MIKTIRNLFGIKKSSGPTQFTCPCCGKGTHDWPALAYNIPVYYGALTENEKKEIAEITSDFCIIRYANETSYFIRCSLFQNVTGCTDQLNYGLWVSLSEKSFQDYKDNYHEHDREGGYFGWISNNLTGYETTTSIPADVFLGTNGNRPEVVPHQSFNHPFVHDYYNGITIEEVHKRITAVLNPGS